MHCYRRISFKAYTNFAGYDVVVVNPALGKTARIQLKSLGDGQRSVIFNQKPSDPGK
jgi:hypothetical protein